MIQPAFSTNKWNCFRSLVISPSRTESRRCHAHVVVGHSDGTAHGGHLLEARVRPTCELILTESTAHLQKKLDPESGIALIQV
jgi:predicted DNA-binding protein with PD1-like motif